MSASLEHPALYCRSLQLRGRRLEKASLFPFFDRQGATRLLMLTTQDSGRIALIGHHAGLFTRRRFRPSRLDVDFGALTNATESEHDRLADLWHFDPWWELGEARYAGHPAVPALKATNIPGHDKTWQTVVFDDTLGIVRRVTLGTTEADPDRDEEGSEASQRYTPRLLKRAEAARFEATDDGWSTTHRAPTGWFKPWRLQPFWE